MERDKKGHPICGQLLCDPAWPVGTRCGTRVKLTGDYCKKHSYAVLGALLCDPAWPTVLKKLTHKKLALC